MREGDEVGLAARTSAKHFLAIVDLEASAWPEGDARRSEMEIIEIGAICARMDTLDPVEEFQSFARPVRHPVLSEFIKELTSIRQEDVDAAPLFPEVMTAFRKWLQDPTQFLFTSWGRYDRNQLLQDTEWHKVPYPFDGLHWNAKRHFARVKDCREVGISGALRKLRLSFEGNHHRALDDARNILRILQVIGIPTDLGKATG